MVRAEILGSYPYPFIDVTTLGYTRSVINAIGFLFGFIIAGSLLLALKRVSWRT